MTVQPFNPDPQAVQFLDASFALLNPDLAILCGSRARGDHTEHSDLDLILVNSAQNISDQNISDKLDELLKAIYQTELPPWVQYIRFDQEAFTKNLRSINGIAARACRYAGVIRAAPGQPMPVWNSRQTEWESLLTDRYQAEALSDLKCVTALLETTDRHFPDIPVTKYVYSAYRSALLTASSKAGVEFQPRSNLLELAAAAAHASPAAAQAQANPRIQLLDALKENDVIRIPRDQPVQWADHLAAIKTDIQDLAGAPAQPTL